MSRIHVPADEVELRDLLDRILDKGVFCVFANLGVLNSTDLSQPSNHISVSAVETNTQTYAGRKAIPPSAKA